MGDEMFEDSLDSGSGAPPGCCEYCGVSGRLYISVSSFRVRICGECLDQGLDRERPKPWPAAPPTKDD